MAGGGLGRAWRAGAMAAALLAGLAVAKDSPRDAKPAAKQSARAAANEQQLKELRARIGKLQADLAAAEKSSGEASDQLKESGQALNEAHRALFAVTQERRGLEAQLADIAGRERDIRSSVERQQALAARLLRLQYEQGASDRLRLLLEGGDAAAISRHVTYYQYIQRARADVINALRGKGDELAALEAQAVARRDELAANQAEQQKEARRLESERRARAAVVAKLAGDIARGRREIGRLKKDEARLARLVEEIARALAAKPAPGKGKPGRSVDEVADASSAAHPFAALKGKLKLPVRGELVNHFGATREEAGTTWKGLFIKAPTGEAVHAVADGRVVYADWLRGFGNLLILDHGKGYMSLYAYNEGLLRRVGDSVRAGDAVASVGATGGEGDSGLYFELRRDGKPFDPMLWVP
jgi:septal ring factor EnvC (AmiA/AmiB activator)